MDRPAKTPNPKEKQARIIRGDDPTYAEVLTKTITNLDVKTDRNKTVVVEAVGLLGNRVTNPKTDRLVNKIRPGAVELIMHLGKYYSLECYPT
jgi:hypothetical protein